MQLGRDRHEGALARERQLATEKYAAKSVKAIRAVRQAVEALQTADLRSFLGTILTLMAEQLEADTGLIFITGANESSVLGWMLERGRLLDGKDALVSLCGAGGLPSARSTIGRGVSVTTTAPAESRDQDGRWSEELRTVLRSRGAERMAVVPIVVDSRAVGACALGVASSWRPRIEERALLEIFAGQLSVAFRLARAAEDARAADLVRHQEQGARLRAESVGRWRHRIDHALERTAASPGVDAALGEVLREAVEQFGAAGGSVWRAGANQVGRLALTLEEGEIREAAPFEHPGLQPGGRDPHITLRVQRGEVRIDDETTLRRHPDYAPFRKYLARRGIRTVVVAGMHLGASLQGALTLRFVENRRLTADETELLANYANQAVLAAEFARLSGAVRTAAVSEERNRLARDVHDTIAQGLAAIIRQLECVGAEAVGDNLMHHVGIALDIARDNLIGARRSIRGLRPASCNGRSFEAAVTELVERSRSLSTADIRLRIRGGPAELPADVEGEVLLILQEALTNTVKHANAKRVDVEVRSSPAALRVSVRDDGRGFDSSRRSSGVGLASMHERAQKVGAALNITSEPGQGTRVVTRWSRPSSSGLQ